MRGLAILFLLFLVACGASQREKAVRSGYIGVTAARDGFLTWDEGQQSRIVDEATSLGEGREALAKYRAERDKVVALFVEAYQAIALTATQEDASLPTMLATLKELYAALERLRTAFAAVSPAPSEVTPTP